MGPPLPSDVYYNLSLILPYYPTFEPSIAMGLSKGEKQDFAGFIKKKGG
jgi:hypothetical protein